LEQGEHGVTSDQQPGSAMPMPSGVAPATPSGTGPPPAVSVTRPTSGGTSGISGGAIPNPNVVTDRMRPETLKELARRSGGR
jgi:hypothetical protein